MAKLELEKEDYECRFYEQEFPDIEECVMCQVVRVQETAAYVKMLEYNNMEGMILLAEVATRRIRSLIKEIRVGQFVVCLVLRVDEERGAVDLSKRRVAADERAKFMVKYSDSKMLHATLKQLTVQHKVPLTKLCESIAWPLYKACSKKSSENLYSGHANDAFREFVNNGKSAHLDAITYPSDAVKTQLFEVMKRKMAPQATKLKARVEVTCFEYTGIEAVKEALQAGLATFDAVEAEKNGSIATIAIKVVAPPTYDIITTSMGKENGVVMIDKALASIEKVITKHSGKYKLVLKPEIIGEDAEDDEDVEDDKKKGDDSDSDSSESDVEGMGNIDIKEN